MKVISGTLKGRKIIDYNMPGTRPTMDRVKESMFAMIQLNIKESVVLDLFAGSGNLAMEAISNGAKEACCVDKGRQACQTIYKNAMNFSIEDQIEIINADFKKALLELKVKKRKFDLIFLDPPYQSTYIEEALSKIKEYHILEKEGKIICETDSISKIATRNHWEIVKQRRYGDKYVVILREM